jgi:predicted CXXCH cytochrome family protein
MAVSLVLAGQLLGSLGAPATRAADPDPSASPSLAPLQSPTPVETPTPAPDLSTPVPTVDPGPTEALPDATADPGATPVSTLPAEPGPTPDPGPPLPTPSPSDVPSSPSPEPSPTPIAWTLSGGQQSGRAAAAPIPLWKLKTSTSAPDPEAIHAVVGLTSSDCAACHASHTAQGADIVNAPAPGSTLCFGCHSGSGSPFDTAAQFSGTPTNDPSSDSYYRHLVESGSSRQVTCTECHNPHDANGTRPVMSTDGWTASGDIRAADGVAVTNGAAGSAPTYTPILRSSGGASLTFEYQLCLACHSGYATLPSANASHPSWWALDKGIELNPANASYHPIEAVGRNRSTQLAASLAGTSPFKAWDYTIDSTIRCTSCHGDPSTVNQSVGGTPKTRAPAVQEAPHASANRGLLIAPYRDRVLKSAGDPYDPTDFALCYLCHAERPFVDPNEIPSAADTAFDLHGFHLADIPGIPGAGTSIDHPGDGGGLAICAECHFRIHSTAIAYKPGDTAPVARATGNTGLVDFAPNVTGPATWTAPNSQGVGSCTLTCHGFTHTALDATYLTAPGTGFTADRTSGSVGSSGLLVQFTDATRYAGPSTASWSWTFGDGGTSTAQSPGHTYTTPGTYTVSLTVTRTSGPGFGLSATMTRAAYITVTP